MPIYAPFQCECGRMLEPDLRLAGKTASSWETCMYRCTCGRGYSNAREPSLRRMITEKPELNVPQQVRKGLSDALAGSANLTNLKAKRQKFCSETSEDAVTWTMFRFLEEDGLLHVVHPEAPSQTPDLLLWGFPVSGAHAPELAESLADISTSLGEARRGRSEPDVVLSWPALLVVIEVKHRSANDRKPDYPHFDRYLDRTDLFTASPKEVARSGYYELARNWRIGAELAERRAARFVLLNLGPPGLAGQADEFGGQLRQSRSRRFAHVSWRDLLDAVGPRQPEWFTTFVEHRLSNSSHAQRR